MEFLWLLCYVLSIYVTKGLQVFWDFWLCWTSTVFEQFLQLSFLDLLKYIWFTFNFLELCCLLQWKVGLISTNFSFFCFGIFQQISMYLYVLHFIVHILYLVYLYFGFQILEMALSILNLSIPMRKNLVLTKVTFTTNEVKRVLEEVNLWCLLTRSPCLMLHAEECINICRWMGILMY